jgi:hypothetical protein
MRNTKLKIQNSKSKIRNLKRAVVLMAAALGVQACVMTGGPPSLPTPIPTPTFLPAPPTVTPTPTPVPEGVWVQPGVPQGVQDSLAPLWEGGGFTPVESAAESTVRVVISPGPEALLTTRQVLAPVAPFPTAPDDLSWEAFGRYWAGDPNALADLGAPMLVLTQDVFELLVARLGPPSSAAPIEIQSFDALLPRAWESRPALSIVPFDRLDPRWKPLTLDGQSVLDRAMNADVYPLTVDVGLVGEGAAALRAADVLTEAGTWQPTNRDPTRITVVVVTGVTAMARATATQMERNGLTFPADEIRPFLADADILHTSNEVAFADDCPEPEPIGDPTFCAQPDYMALLLDIGLDVVELTGNHVNDWGTGALDYTLDIYDEDGIVYYGGGRDAADAVEPAIVTAPTGLRIAFVGCNSPGPPYAWAGDETPGAAPCGDWSGITGHIRALRESGQADVIIATLQYVELDRYDPSPQQVVDFQRLADAGAHIVSGSQAHQPQGFAITADTFIHYGVGNLFFDQMDRVENRQMFADRHVFYDNRHIATVLFTGMMEYWSQPRPMTSDERAAFLQTIFEASGW